MRHDTCERRRVTLLMLPPLAIYRPARDTAPCKHGFVPATAGSTRLRYCRVSLRYSLVLHYCRQPTWIATARTSHRNATDETVYGRM